MLLPEGIVATDCHDFNLSIILGNMLNQESYSVCVGGDIHTDYKFEDLIQFLQDKYNFQIDINAKYDTGGSISRFAYGFLQEGYCELKCWYRESVENISICLNFIGHEPEHFEKILQELKNTFPEGTQNLPNEVRFKFFWKHPNGSAASRSKKIITSSWDSITQNYVSTDTLNDLFNVDQDHLSNAGKLILLHGCAGTGKSHVIRSLAQKWKSWTDFNYLLDPHNFFANADYMNQIILDTDAYDDKYQIFVAEDTDEFIQADSKNRTGQGLSMLLNITDGIIGQGMKMLFIITTNEPLAKLHPAVTRPGRCLANIEFEAFEKSNAIRWLNNHGLDETHLPNAHQNNGEYTLAELYNVISTFSPKQINQKANNQNEYQGMYV